MKTDIFTTDLEKPDDAAHSIDLRFDLELSPEEVAGIAEAAGAEYAMRLAERESEPHVVHQANAYEDVPDETVTDPTDPRKGTKVKGKRYVGLVDCPDCTRGLISRGDHLVCVTVPRSTLTGTKGDIVACGRPR